MRRTLLPPLPRQLLHPVLRQDQLPRLPRLPFPQHQYEDKYRLCYMRGPAGIIVSLAEELF